MQCGEEDARLSFCLSRLRLSVECSPGKVFMCSALHQRIVVAIEMAINEGTFVRRRRFFV
jgi:hypothetical protein